MGRLQDLVLGRPGDQMMGRSGTSVKLRYILNPTQKHIKLTLTGYSKRYGEL